MAMNGSASQRLLELLAGEAAGDLGADEQAELRMVRGGAERNDLMRVAALVQLACLARDRKPARHIPADLEAQLAARAMNWASGAAAPRVSDLDEARRRRAAAQPPAPAPGPTRTIHDRTGWYAAAGLALALGLSLVYRPYGPAPVVPQAAVVEDLAARRSALLGEPGVVKAPWARSEQPQYAAVTGDVVWSPARQEGYLRLDGLPRNDPSRQQYQLWIVSPGRDRHPVDGGVFDVTRSGEVVVKIDPKLAVGDAAAFAITLEQPGGVVVSTQPLLLVAAVSG
jgi:anti-sigma-K factor RskA